MSVYTDFSPSALRQLRQLKGLSLQSIARQCGVTRQAVWEWETGKALPSRRSILKLINVLGIEPTQIAQNHYRRIAISGTHGVGKTTLAKQLSEILRLPLLTETAREVIQQYVSDCSYMVCHPDKAEIQAKILNKQIEKEATHKAFVSDRSVLDVLAYSCLYRIFDSPTLHELAKKILLTYSKNYDLIIFCPIPDDDYEIPDDGFRLTDKDSQMDIDNYLKCLLATKPTDVLYLPPDRSVWLQTTLDYINYSQGGKENE